MYDLKKRILSNSFIDQIRTQMEIDEREYIDLCDALRELAEQWRETSMVDKELVLILYCAPQMVRNVFLSFSGQQPPPPISQQLEDIWMELDQLVIECLAEA